jgi:hypothetical protein
MKVSKELIGKFLINTKSNLIGKIIHVFNDETIRVDWFQKLPTKKYTRVIDINNTLYGWIDAVTYKPTELKGWELKDFEELPDEDALVRIKIPMEILNQIEALVYNQEIQKIVKYI